jgi:hypothetical protein
MLTSEDAPRSPTSSHPPPAARLLDLSSYLAEPQRRGLISLSEVYATLQTSIWAELKTGAEVERLRRNLQREYLKRLQAVTSAGLDVLLRDLIDRVFKGET